MKNKNRVPVNKKVQPTCCKSTWKHVIECGIQRQTVMRQVSIVTIVVKLFAHSLHVDKSCKILIKYINDTNVVKY